MKYSVALCTYNGELYLEEQLNSILRQTLLPAEIVICDDSSSDGTNDIIESIVKNNNGIRWKHYINRQNIGYVKNFEQAIRLCEEEIIFLSDQDDIWIINKAETILNIFSRNGCSLLFSDAKIVDPILKDYNLTMFERLKFDTMEQQKFLKGKNAMFYLLANCLVTGATITFKRDFGFRCLPFPETKLFAHDEWLATIAAICGGIDFFNKPLILYRQHTDQAIGANISGFYSIQRKQRQNRIETLMNILNLKKEKEKFFLDFFARNSNVSLNKELSILTRRMAMYRRILKRPKSKLRRLFRLSYSLYRLRIPEFSTLRLFLGNSWHYVFDK